MEPNLPGTDDAAALSGRSSDVSDVTPRRHTFTVTVSKEVAAGVAPLSPIASITARPRPAAVPCPSGSLKRQLGLGDCIAPHSIDPSWRRCWIPHSPPLPSSDGAAPRHGHYLMLKEGSM
ncbi:hypothetical protein CHLRE_09g386757v5 [Chlamydomonas reinhardtii]|uniref:Uncharacterized protein n=1 Tax=Chlamydomonas reinhardtii TaxID=3055 RepID=A0A2K3DCI0_CHLRE|nr:uncharacterized protein CHLRE_09g386757v5 [Chlamydomonas reinhardtii]PNW78235.1 hypothetical protein CHLRE_09g386757v5 [Chlamydomonas reinhardtii]